MDCILKDQDDIFVVFNVVFLQYSLFLYSEKNVVCEKFVYIFYLFFNVEMFIFNSYMNIVVVEIGSEFVYIEGQFEKQGVIGIYFNNIYNCVVVGFNVYIYYYCLQQEGVEGFVVNWVDVEQDCDS